jgi:protein-disulfide isomerase
MRSIRLAARLTILAAAALFSLGAGEPAPSANGPHPNWLTTVSVSPSGGHLLGNPAAPVKLVEYISYTCPHCAHFQKQAEVAMRLAYLQPGKVQIEVRHLIRDPIDMVAAMLANCGAPDRFFANHNMFLQTQEKWAGLMTTATAAQKARWTSGPNLARMRAIASDFGFYTLMGQRGYSRPQLDHCLADMTVANRIAAQTVEADKLGVAGTPAFMLDGVLLAGTYDWESLNTQLEARF